MKLAKYISTYIMLFHSIRDAPLENLWGGGGVGGGAGEVQDKYSRKEKNSCTPINPKKYSCYDLKKNSYKQFDDKKKFPRLENSPPHPPP